MDGNIIDVGKALVGDNIPPFHPNCRCSTAAYDDGSEFEKALDELRGRPRTAEEIAEDEKTEVLVRAEEERIRAKFFEDKRKKDNEYFGRHGKLSS